MAAKTGMMDAIQNRVFGPEESNAADNDRLLLAELDEIAASRAMRQQPPLPSHPELPPIDQARLAGLTGLAFSGGGIRSATFCLGVLHALSEANLLRTFDYLSTVSGGGYIGSWLAAYIKRRPNGVLDVERELSAPDSAMKTTPVGFLRDYSNYLAPRPGMFSVDTWTIASVWLRNTVLNQAVLVLLLSFALLAPRALGLAMPWVAWNPVLGWLLFTEERPPLLPAVGASILLLWAAVRIAQNLRWFDSDHPNTAAPEIQQKSVIGTAVILLLSAWFAAASLWHGADASWAPTFAGVVFAIAVGILAVLSGLPKCFASVVGPRRAGWWPVVAILVSVLAGAAGAGLTMLLLDLFKSWAHQGPEGAWNLAVWGAPAVLLLMAAVSVLQIGLLGRWLPDDRREWWSRLGAWVAIFSAGTFALASLSIYGPLITAKLFTWSKTIASGITVGWLLTTISGVLAGKSADTGGDPATAKPKSPGIVKEWIGAIAPYIAIAGFLLALSTVLNLVLSAALCRGYACCQPSAPISGLSSLCQQKNGFFPGWTFLQTQHWNLLGPLQRSIPEFPGAAGTGDMAAYWAVIWLGLIVTAAVGLLLAWRVDINEFSLHHFYRNRLVRCYLGASNPERRANPVTGFDKNDDMLLATLHHSRKANVDEFAYAGPYLIVNGALNYTHGRRLAWQERKAASFIFSPLYCGYDAAMISGSARQGLSEDAYRPTPEYAYPNEKTHLGGVHLGTAMAISGAAASPNMGYHTSPALAFLMTLFDVRLGWWLGNPRHDRKWKRSGPALGLLYLLDELFGSTDSDSDYVYISDGGHFENLAVYELVRRRAKLIVACDAEQDGSFTFGGLGGLVRKCRADFGVDIDLDLRPLLDRDAKGRPTVHGGVGVIRYPEGTTGTLVYLKSSLTQLALHSEPADVLEYSMRAKEFPHETTADQFFDESQFESYRELGLHIGRLAITQLREASIL